MNITQFARQLTQLKIKEGSLISVKYWDHYGDTEDGKIGALQEASGHFAGVIPHKFPLLKLAMHSDKSFPFMFILTNCIEKIEKR